MSAHAKAPFGKIVDLPSVADELFLTKVVEILERLRSESDRRGHPLLASLLQIAREEASDDLATRTEALLFSQGSPKAPDTGEDEGLMRMAEKLAYRGGNEDTPEAGSDI
jgi:hypothetical protein